VWYWNVVFDNAKDTPLRPPMAFWKPHVFKELGAIKATSLHRKVTKPLKSSEKQQEDKTRGWRGEGALRCRNANATHVRGCWVVDLVLGKT